MSLIVLDQNILALSNTVARASITIQDSTGSDADPVELHLDMMDLSSTVIFTDTWPSPSARIVRDTIGRFHVDIGGAGFEIETANIGEYLLDWRIQLVTGGNIQHSLQKIKIITARAASFIPEFRLMIDKSRKIVDTNNDCMLGYNDSQLYSYLEGGLGAINSYQPSVMFSMQNYPIEQRQMLIDAALMVGVMSQQLFAIDTDIPNYNDQGTSFVIAHQPQLASFLNQVTQRLDKMIPMMKLFYINSGGVHVQMGPSYRLQQIMEAAPGGALFRNVYFKA